MDTVSNGPLIIIDMEIVTTFTGTISKKMYFFKFIFNKSETVTFIPTVWKGIDRNLTTYSKMKTDIREFCFQSINKGLPYFLFIVQGCKFITISLAYLKIEREKVYFNKKQDWKGSQSPRLRRIAVGYNLLTMVLETTWWLQWPSGLVWREPDENLTRIWQESDENLTIIWREFDENLFMMIDNSYFMELHKAIRESSGQQGKTNKAGPRRLALVQR